MGFKNEGDEILLIGREQDASNPIIDRAGIGQSTYLKTCHELDGSAAGIPPEVDLDFERKIGEAIQGLIASGAVTAVHDVSDGGLLTAVSEMAMAGGFGAELFLGYHPTLTAFSEAQGYYVVTVSSDEKRWEVERLIGTPGVMVEEVGTVGGLSLRLKKKRDQADDFVFEEVANVSLTDLRAAHASFFKDWMEG